MLFTALLKIESARIHDFSKEHEMALGAHISNWVFLWRIIWQNVDNKRNTLPTDWYVRYLTINNHLLSFKFLILIFFFTMEFSFAHSFFQTSWRYITMNILLCLRWADLGVAVGCKLSPWLQSLYYFPIFIPTIQLPPCQFPTQL